MDDLTVVDTTTELDTFRKILSKKLGRLIRRTKVTGSLATQLITCVCTETPFSAKKFRTVSEVGVWEELELLYKDMEQKDKDYQTAVKIGKLMLNRNEELMNKNEEIKHKYDLLLQEHENERARILAIEENERKSKEEASRKWLEDGVDDLYASPQQLKGQIKELQMRIELLEAAKADAEQKFSSLNEEHTKMEAQVTRYENLLKTYKRKNKDLVDESEQYKVELDNTRRSQMDLRRKMRMKNPFEAPDELASEDPTSSDSAADQKLNTLIKELKQQNAKLEDTLAEVQSENSTLKYKLNSLMKDNDERMRSISLANTADDARNLENQVKMLQMRVELLQSSKKEAETKAAELAEEFNKMEQTMQRYETQLKQYKSKNAELNKELNKLKGNKSRTEETEDRLKELERKVADLTEEKAVLVEQHEREKQALMEKMGALAQVPLDEDTIPRKRSSSTTEAMERMELEQMNVEAAAKKGWCSGLFSCCRPRPKHQALQV